MILRREKSLRVAPGMIFSNMLAWCMDSLYERQASIFQAKKRIKF